METLVIKGWPYQEIEGAYGEFVLETSEKPLFLVVGWRLWSLLMNATEQEIELFYTVDAVPIKLDKLGILEPSEFMFTH